MKPNQRLLISGLCVAGLISGYAGNRLLVSRDSDPPPPTGPAASARGVDESSATGSTHESPRQRARTNAASTVTLSTLRSSDTLESLIAITDDSLYGRLALWMIDASEPEIAAFYDHYRQSEAGQNEINDLIFINWTRLDPKAAIDASVGSSDAHYAWWAWACHDPALALGTAIASAPERVNNVTWGIGEFHPDWLRENFNKLPEESRGNALSGLAKWGDVQDPLATLKFFKENSYGFHQETFNSLIRKDPWTAFDWLQESGNNGGMRYEIDSAMDNFARILVNSDPKLLERFIAQTPSGSARRTLEAAHFKSLAASDPDTALEKAMKATAPLTAAHQLSTVALKLLPTDPGKAFELAGKLFADHPNILTAGFKSSYPNGNMSWGSSQPELNSLIDLLVLKDPDRLMTEVATPGAGVQGLNAMEHIASKWAGQDIAGYAAWLDRQTAPELRNPATAVLANQLTGMGQHEEAMDWAATITGPDAINATANVYYRWRSSDPAAAESWLESANLPEDQLDVLKSLR